MSTSTFAGAVDAYGTMIWANLRNRDLLGGTFRFHNEKSLTLGKTATSASPRDAGASSAVDGSGS